MKNNLEIYVDYVKPVVKSINEHHNEFYDLQYYSLSPEDLTAEDGLVEFMTERKNRPEHFSGNIPMIYAQYGEETGASMVLELSAEQRKLLSPDVATTLLGEQYKLWEDGVVYLLMDHEYYQTCSGFTVTEQIDPTNGGVGNALDFVSRSLGLDYLSIHVGKSDLEWLLKQ
tara:strand:- start:67 stop:579 length:513 start_codon:yes stop_codon:yes gene_type:complete